MLEMLHNWYGRHAVVPMQNDSFTFSSSGTGPYIGQSRATQGKGLGIEDRFFPHLEGMQFEGAIGRQVLRGGLIESQSPILKRAKIQEALCYLLTCLWRTNRVTKHHGDIAHQSIVHQSCSIRGQKMQILRGQTKERKTIPSIVADQFCFCIISLGQLFLCIDVYNIFFYV